MSEKDTNKINEIEKENNKTTDEIANEKSIDNLDETQNIEIEKEEEISKNETKEIITEEDLIINSEDLSEDINEEISITAEDDEDNGFFSTLLSVIGNVIFSLFLIMLMAVVTLNIASFLNGNTVSFLNKRIYIAGENTMSPIIRENDAIIVDERKAHQVEDGDLIVYETIDGEVVTGWVTSILDKDRFEIKKDINSSDSIIIDGIAIIGVASLRVQNMGDFIEFISKPTSLILILAVGIIIYMGIWLISKPRKSVRN